MTTVDREAPSQEGLAQAALWLRVGLGIIFVAGGWNKLSKLLDPAREEALVGSYMSTNGYINAFFQEYLFADGGLSWLTPWLFLMSLSAFELISGILLIVGLAVRPLALIYGFLLWTFVIALPVVTTPGVEVTVKTYLSPAILVQIRDICLSGLMFVLFNLGSGARSLDERLCGCSPLREAVNWNPLGVLLRLSLAAVFIVTGMFFGMDHIASFASTPWVLLPIGLLFASGHFVRVAGAATVAVMLWYMWTKLNIDKSLIANLNSIKREFALIAAGMVAVRLGGGTYFILLEEVKKAHACVSGCFASLSK